MKPRVLILTGYGINAEKELKWAFDLAGGDSKIVHLEDLATDTSILDNYQILAFPGGFSFGDHISSGKVYANMVEKQLKSALENFINSDKLVIGICNGFQVITKLGIVPATTEFFNPEVSLCENDSAHFEDRWVWLDVKSTNSPWLNGLDKLYLPVRHGEGKIRVKDETLLSTVLEKGYAPLRYIHPEGKEAVYPYNPNGSVHDIAGLTDPTGKVFGLMPHPEAYIYDELHPRWTEGIREKHTGLDIFKNGIIYFT